MKGRLLIIDDEDLFREDLATLLREEGHQCFTAADGEAGLELAEAVGPDLILSDVVMPRLGGVELVEAVASRLPDVPIILVTAFGTMETALEAFRRGAADYLLKPVEPEALLRKVCRTLEHRNMLAELRYLRRQLRNAAAGDCLVGKSAAMEEIRGLIGKVAPTGSTVLVTGESGTGKELVARSIHEAGQRPEAPFVAVNCAALPRDLFESELFGHVRGAFTGAHRRRTGFFEIARDGTLFLDEVSELPLDLQPKLLRAIESGEIVPVGAERPVPFQARLLAATNRDLEAAMREGRFREDLFYRIRVVEIPIPPLRERREDIPALVEHFLPRLNARLKKRVLGVSPDAMRVLMSAPWRGNVRELENVLERGAILAEEGPLRQEHLPRDLQMGSPRPASGDDLRAAVKAYEAAHIRRVLEEAGGNREEAARRLGVNPSTLYRRLKEPDF